MSSDHSLPVSIAVTLAVSGLLACLLTPGCWRTGAPPPEDPKRLTIQLSSPAFAEGGMIPKEFTCEGSDLSPPVAWSGVPASARTLSLICDDPDAPSGTWSHWVVFNLPSQVKALKGGIPLGESIPETSIEGSEPAGQASSKPQQGKNDFGKAGYGGPCPPSGTHRYFFRLYALDATLELGSAATRSDVLKAIEGHLLAEGRLIGKYQKGAKR
jgi:Raf kinase inhibitor-like YbhB/YbcL family protein